jgi:hypothetical protein
MVCNGVGVEENVVVEVEEEEAPETAENEERFQIYGLASRCSTL